MIEFFSLLCVVERQNALRDASLFEVQGVSVPFLRFPMIPYQRIGAHLLHPVPDWGDQGHRHVGHLGALNSALPQSER